MSAVPRFSKARPAVLWWITPFGEEDDAESFVAEYGDEPLEVEEVDRGPLEGL